MIHKAKDLSDDQRKVIESLLGRSVLEAQAISVRSFGPPAVPNAQRRKIAEKLKNTSLKCMRDVNLFPMKADATITEAIRNSRPNYRPHR